MPFYPNPLEDVTTAPFRRTVGHEVEYSSGWEVCALLRERGHGTPGGNFGDGLHYAGCSCDQRDNYPVHTTSDGTAAGGEYLIGGSRGVLFGSPAYATATRVLSEAAMEIGCGTNERVGMHTHVGLQAEDGRTLLSWDQQVNILRVYLRYEDELQQLAAGPRDAPRNNGYATARLDRGYLRVDVDRRSEFWNSDNLNRDVELPARPTLNFHTGKNTVEFRIWNSTVAQWRMMVAGAVSAAIVEAGATGRRAHPDSTATLVEFLDGLLTADMVMLIERQRRKYA